MDNLDSQTDLLGNPTNTEDNIESSFSIPEKYQNKSPEDLVKMHMEAERRVSQLGNEVGSLRQISDQLLGLKREELTKQPVREAKPVTVDELLQDPDAVLERAVSDNPRLTTALSRVEQMERNLAQKEFEVSYPTFKEDIANPEFGEWIKTNKVRTALGVAANNGDYTAANSLWSLWKERQQDMASANADKSRKRQQQERAGILEGSSTRGGDTSKTYNRSELLELHRRALLGDRAAKAKWEDPKFQEDRTRAYVEGRVK